RTLRYRGAVDDQYSLDERSTGRRKAHPEKRWLRDAILALLEDRAVDPSLTTAAGCVLGRKPVEREKKPLTYHADVEPIIQERCQPCHRKGQIAPFELATFDDVAGWSGMIREVVENRRMPPWHANPSHGHFENDRSLSEAERETILGWIAAGAPRGNPTDAPPPKEFPGGGWQIGEPDVVLEMPRAYRVPAQGTVSYQYFTIRTSFDEDRWVQAMEVLPGAREVVHHILVFCVDPKNPRGWQRETGGGVRGYFGVMVPGERPCVYPEGLGKRLPKGATLVFQVHYTTNGRAVQDRSKIGLIFSRSPVRHEVRTQSAHETRLRIPPRTPDHQVRATYRFSRDAMLLSLLPHMHLRGSAFRYTAHYPEGVQLSRAPDRSRLPRALDRRVRWEDETKTLVFTGAMTEDELRALVELYDEPSDQSALADLRARTRSEILLDVPSYDFGWQSSYQLAEPKRMPRGTVIEALAVFDNSPSNRALTTEEWSSWVRWGEQTWEEMLIGYFDFYDVSGDDESTP
ncbi:MAG TPA: hypothetical protein VK116_15100, partial [Planctomycetota bacterium]|nr:hypothetical protein [Planctomycetota bacterium]